MSATNPVLYSATNPVSNITFSIFFLHIKKFCFLLNVGEKIEIPFLHDKVKVGSNRFSTIKTFKVKIAIG